MKKMAARIDSTQFLASFETDLTNGTVSLAEALTRGTVVNSALLVKQDNVRPVEHFRQLLESFLLVHAAHLLNRVQFKYGTDASRRL